MRTTPAGIQPAPSVGDVNPSCTSNAVFVDSAMGGDYWTTYGSQDSEQRTYNANWTRNILGLQGAHGVGHGVAGCGCAACAAVAPPAPPAPCAKQPVAQTPCDTRWQQPDYPPTEGPTDADIRCAGCYWVDRVVPQGVGSMEGIMRGGRMVQGFAAAPPSTTPPQTGLAAPAPQGLGVINPNATNPATVGLVAALGGVAGSLLGAAIGSEIGTAYGEVAERRAAVGGLFGVMAGAFVGAAIAAPSVQAQQGA